MSVTWRRLTLAGFGRYEAEAAMELSDGVNVLVAPNESGKSTLAAGLAAVLFGLPATSDPDEFSQARYRNWNGPDRFEGTLEFAVDGQVYRIRRRFATHSVTVSRQTEDGWQDILSGEHNPRARRANVEYEEFLERTVGVVDRELFVDTFAFTQPLPGAGELDGRVQAMITGAGTAQFNKALDVLVAEGRRLTKFTRELGLSSRDAVNDGELEAVGHRITALREALEASRSTVDAGQSLQRQMSRLQVDMQTLRRELEDVENQISVWTQWTKLADDQRAALQQQSQLQRAWETYKALELELQSRRRALRDEFPELVDAPADTGERLDEIDQLQSDVAAKRRELVTELGALKRRVDELLDEWRRFVEDRERWSELRRRLREEYSPFEEADDEARGYCAAYRATKSALELEIERVRTELDRRREARTALAAARGRFNETYGDLDQLSDDAVAAVDERLELMHEREQLKADLDVATQTEHKARRVAIGTRLLGAAALVIAAGVGMYAETSIWIIVTALLAGSLVAAQAWLIARRSMSTPEIDGLADRLTAVDEALAGDTRLGPFTELSVPDLRALRERLLARQQAAAVLAEREEAVPRTADEDERLTRKLAAAEAALARFGEATAPARARFGEHVERAYESWMELRQEERRARQELRSFSRRHFGLDTTTPEDTLIADLPDGSLPGVWRDVARLLEEARVVSGPLTVGRVVTAAQALTDEDVARAADIHAENRSDLIALRRRLAELRERHAAVLHAAGDDVGVARQRWADYQRRMAAATMMEKELAGVLAGQGVASDEDLHTRSLQAANAAVDVQRRLEELASEHPWLPGPDEEVAALDVRTKLRELTERRDELQRRRAADEERMLKLREQLADLSGRNVVNVAEAEQELAELEERRSRLALEADVVALAYSELRQAAEDFQQTHRERLARAAGDYLRRFTGRARTVVLDEQFRVQVQDPDGPLHGASQLSQGAQDQLYLALRLAIADLVADDVALPLLLDDPFVNCDDERLSRIRDALHSLGGGRQVVLFSHRDVFLEWGQPVIVRVKEEPA